MSDRERKVRILVLVAPGDRPVGAQGPDLASNRHPADPREGRQRKLGAMLGCCVPLAILLAGGTLLSFFATRWL